MGAGSKKNRRKNPADDNGVDLLTLAFNIPTRRDFERVEREVAQDEAHTQGVRVQYDAREDDYRVAESPFVSKLNITRPDTSDPDETPKARKPSKPRPQYQPQEQTAAVYASSANDHPKPSNQEPPPMRRPSKRDSKSSKARERASSSPASFRAPSPAFAIPASATFPSAVPNYAQQGANFAAPDAFTQPLHASIGGGAQPQQYYQPMFAYPAVSMYPPAQYYSPVPGDPVAGGNQYVPFPTTPNPSTTTHTSPQTSSMISQQVQDIQSKIDDVAMKLSQHPEDVALKSTLSALQTELNTKLNSLLGMEARKDSKVSDAPTPTPHDLKANLSQSQATATQREKVLKKGIRHHLCTGCGNVRSSDYHHKHPIIPGGNPSINYCEDCFEAKVEDGDLEHHVCYGCGAARSKEFHHNHPISKGDRPFPNYCSVCVEEVRSAGTIADVSMVNFAPGNRPYKGGASYSGAARDHAQSNRAVDAFGPIQKMSGQEKQPDVLLFSAHSETSEQVHPREQKNVPHPPKLAPSDPQLSPSDSSPGSPYYPVRYVGTSHRRAERSPLTSPGCQHCSSPDTPTTPKYQPPYVEDLVSPVEETKPAFGNSQFQSTTSGRQHSQGEHPHHPTKAAKPGSPQEASDGSIGGHTSTEDSAQSGSSKSVKFRPKVDIRFSDSRTSSNASSHVQIVEEDIKPNEETIPSRVGIYGTSPIKSSNGYLPRCQTPHGVQYSPAAEDGSAEAIPERSYRGAFSKDSPASSWMPPTTNAGDHWYSRPSAYQATTSPSTESFTGYRPGARSTFNYGSGGDDMGGTGVPPPLRTTRSSPADTGSKEESQTSPQTPNSGPQQRTFSGSSSNGWSYYSSPYGGGFDESGFRKPSPWSNFSSWYDPECHTMREESSYSQEAFSDYSQPSPNPYYQPRKRSFPDLSSYCSFGTQPRRTPGKWANDYKSTTAKAPRPTPYWIPEPIIEEPDSPDSSPAKKVNMLEYNIEISPKSISNTATSSSPDSADEDLDHVAGSETDDESGEENDFSNSSLDTPSLD